MNLPHLSHKIGLNQNLATTPERKVSQDLREWLEAHMHHKELRNLVNLEYQSLQVVWEVKNKQVLQPLIFMMKE